MNIADRVIQAAGGVSALAKAIGGITDKAIYQWRDNGKIPASRVLDVERITGISRHELRPDIYGTPDEAA